jgi:hypothetical protein
MRLSVHVVAGVPVGGAQVTADVHRPDGSSVPLVLSDDGNAASGDEKPDDGVYSAAFAAYTLAGPYDFRVRVVNVDGQAASNQECGAFGSGEEGQVVAPIPPFEASASQVLLLEGLAAPPAAGAGALAPHPALAPPAAVDVLAAPPTPVAGFALEAAAGEHLILDELRLVVLDDAGRPDLLAGLALHADADGDGALDVPSRPLASASPSGDALVFRAAGGARALCAPGTSARFLLTVGEALAPDGAGGGTLAPRGADGAGGAARHARVPRAAPWLALLLAVALLYTSRASRPPRARVAAGSAALLLGAALVACAGGSGASVRQTVLRLLPDGASVRGASSDAPVPLGGQQLDFFCDLR